MSRMIEVLTLSDNVALFLSSVCSIFDSRSLEIGSLHFDKDDELALAFVTSSSNLRALCYGIPSTSIFEIKGTQLCAHDYLMILW